MTAGFKVRLEKIAIIPVGALLVELDLERVPFLPITGKE